MRVTGGELRGRVLRTPRGDTVRPTADRVREAVFSSLGDLSGCCVFDGYAGTGSLGIEALSRGAAHAVFAERSARVLEVLRANLRDLGLVERSDVERGGVTQVLARIAARAPDLRFDCVFLDPPYRGAEAPRALEALRDTGVLGAAARILVEISRFHPLETPPGYRRVDERRYGDTVMVYLAPQGKP